MDGRAMWQPWEEMRRLQGEMERLFGDLTPTWRWPLTGEYPPINVMRGDAHITVDALCSGVDRPTLEIAVLGDAVMMRGQRKDDPGAAEERYHRRERPLGAFTRTVSLGEPLDPDRTQATYAQGILTLRLARAPEATPKKIVIQN